MKYWHACAAFTAFCLCMTALDRELMPAWAAGATFFAVAGLFSWGATKV